MAGLNPAESILVAAESARTPDAVRLIAALSAELGPLYGTDGSSGFDPAQVEVSGAAFVVARVDGAAVGCGALRPYAPGVGEVKRMYVAPECRGRGVGRRLLAAIEAEARRAGYARLILETGVFQTEALALYPRAGWERIPCYDDYAHDPHSVCFGKELPPP
jgi:GNAT superfamily N-acetyltransferase